MHFRIDRSKKEAAYLQIYRQLREEIIRGSFRFDEKMPSKRELAVETGTSVITAEHAYALLCDEGYLEARERSGYFVCYLRADSFPVADFENTEGLVSDAGMKSGAGTGKDILSNGSEAAGLAKGLRNPDEERFPYSVFAKTIRRVLTEKGEAILERTPNSGLPELREAIRAYLARSRGINVKTNQIVVGAGAEYLYGLVVQMLGRKKIYGLEDPSYEKIRKVYEKNGAVCDMLKLGRSGIRTGELRRTKAEVLHVTPFNSYPSGVTANASKRSEYIRWAKERGAVIVEDDYDSEYSELTKAEDTLFSLEPHETVIYINTFSRTVASSMRMGYMVLPDRYAAEMKKKIDIYACAVPTLEQYVLAELMNNGDFERHINRVRRQRRKM